MTTILPGVPWFSLGDVVTVKGEKHKGRATVTDVCRFPLEADQQDSRWKMDQPFPQLRVRMDGGMHVHFNAKDLKNKKLVRVAGTTPATGTALKPTERRWAVVSAIRTARQADPKTFPLAIQEDFDVYYETVERVFFCGLDTGFFLFEGNIYSITEVANKMYRVHYYKAYKAPTVELGEE